jgi:hypothetical protein
LIVLVLAVQFPSSVSNATLSIVKFTAPNFTPTPWSLHTGALLWFSLPATKPSPTRNEIYNVVTAVAGFVLRAKPTVVA